MRRPESFDTDLIAEWGEWVLEHGPPELPEVVARDESVPVAYWAGPLVGAVLYGQRSANDDAGEDDRVDTEILCFARTATGWEPGAGQGGSGPTGPRLTRITVPADYVAFVGGFETGGDGWLCTAVEVLVGDRAVWIELTDAETTTRRPVEACDRLLSLRQGTGDDQSFRRRRDRDWSTHRLVDRRAAHCSRHVRTSMLSAGIEDRSI